VKKIDDSKISRKEDTCFLIIRRDDDRYWVIVGGAVTVTESCI